jgi:hypothetical protein
VNLAPNWLDLLDAEFGAEELESAPRNLIEQIPPRCPGGCLSPFWAKKQATNGNWYVGIWCGKCRRFADLETFPKIGLRGKWADHAWVEQHIGPIQSLPKADFDGPQYKYLCTMCRQTDFVEWHHWFPQGIYGWNVAGRLPIATLCRDCHNEASAAQREFCKRIMAKALKLAHKQMEELS